MSDPQITQRDEEDLASYDKAIEIHPKDPDAWFNRGNALGILGRYEYFCLKQAIDHF